MKKSIIFSIIGFLIFVGCGGGASSTSDHSTPENPEVKEISGVIEKGSLQQGANVQASEWNPISGYSGKIFTATTYDNEGSYSISSTELQGILDIKADGFFINENTGSVENSSRIILEGLVDSSTTQNNINIITHIIKQRVMYLMVNNSMTFANANTQAITELYSTLDWTAENPLNTSISENSKLLFLSAVICKDKSVAEVSNILTILSNDLKEDGIVDITILNDQIVAVDCSTVETNITNLYGTSPDIDAVKTQVMDYLNLEEVIPPVDPPVITYEYSYTITALPVDTSFFYLITSTKELWYYKNKVLSKVNATYNETKNTYTDGVLTDTIVTSNISCVFTDFYTTGTGTSKVYYFTINGRNYKQEASIVTEITTLPTRHIKSRFTGTVGSFNVVTSTVSVMFSYVRGYNSTNQFDTDIITDCVQDYGPTGSGWQTHNCAFVNASKKIVITSVTPGLYYLPYGSGNTVKLLKEGLGEMW